MSLAKRTEKLPEFISYSLWVFKSLFKIFMLDNLWTPSDSFIHCISEFGQFGQIHVWLFHCVGFFLNFLLR